MEKRPNMKRISLIFLSFLLLFSTGCAKSSLFSNYRPIEQLKLVHVMGFDAHEDGLELSICGGEQGEEGQELVRLSCTGKNISDCLEKLQNYSEKSELYYAHTRYVIVGEDYARQGLGDVMQYLESSRQLRSDIPLFIVKGGKAKDPVLKAGSEKEGIHDVLEAVIRDCDRQGMGFPFTCGDIGSFSAEYGSALACALTLAQTKDTDPQAKDEEVTPIAAGYGIVDYGTLTAFLSKDASRAVNLLIGELGTGAVTLTAEGQPVSLRFSKSKNSLMPTFGSAGTMTQLKAQLQLEAEPMESEQEHPIDNTKLESAVSHTVKAWLNELFLAMRSTKCDFLGLGARIAIHNPKEMTHAPIPWTEQLDTLSMIAEVDCIIHHKENEARTKEGQS